LGARIQICESQIFYSQINFTFLGGRELERKRSPGYVFDLKLRKSESVPKPFAHSVVSLSPSFVIAKAKMKASTEVPQNYLAQWKEFATKRVYYPCLMHCPL